MEQNLGCRIDIKFSESSQFFREGEKTQTLRNVTEIHYNYPGAVKGKSIAFESDIQGTGITHILSDIEEFETVLESEIAEAF